MASTNFLLVYSPRAQRDLKKLPPREAGQILDDLQKLALPQKAWPSGQVKKLRGHPYSEIKTGDYRTIFLCQGQKVIVLRSVNRRELERELRRIDWHWLTQWLKEL